MSASILGRGERLLTGRYLLFAQGQECGEERFSIERGLEGWTLSGEQESVAPHPIPTRHEYRVALGPEGRVRGVEIRWTVGGRTLLATHQADAETWRVRIEYGDQVKEQHGDYPMGCEVDYGTHLMSSVLLWRRDFAVGGEHEFHALRIGPPFMAVTPERMKFRCAEAAERITPFGVRPAKRYVVSLPPRPESEGYTFWADADGFVLESWDDAERLRPWMRLVNLVRG